MELVGQVGLHDILPTFSQKNMKGTKNPLASAIHVF